MAIKKYEMPNGKVVVFEYDAYGVGKITLEAMDSLIELAGERKEGKWIKDTRYSGWTCTHCNYHDGNRTDNYCPNCGAKMIGE